MMPAEVAPANLESQGRSSALWARARTITEAERFTRTLGQEHALSVAEESRVSLREANKHSSLNYDNEAWLAVVRPAIQGATSRFVLIPWVVVTVIALVIEGFELLGAPERLPSTVPVAFGGLMSLLLAFRLNSSFGRWQEARTLWGVLIVTSRALMLHLTAAAAHGGLQPISGGQRRDGRIDDEQPECPAAAAAWTLGFATALKLHLRKSPMPPTRSDDRNGDLPPGLHRLLSVRQLRELAEASHPPMYALRELRLALEEGLHDIKRPAFEAKCLDCVEALVGALTGCERILRTPCPPGYVGLLRGVCVVWMLMLPFALVEVLGWIMVPVVSLTSLLVLAIEQLAVQIENPFGEDANDLPLDAFCLTVETELIQALAESSSAQPFRDFEAEQRASPSRSV